jgi:hypothetical protein
MLNNHTTQRRLQDLDLSPPGSKLALMIAREPFDQGRAQGAHNDIASRFDELSGFGSRTLA